MFKTALPLLFGFSALFSLTPVALSAPEVLPQATAPSHPSECSASQKDSIALKPLSYLEGSPSEPANIEFEVGDTVVIRRGYLYTRVGAVQTECEKNKPVPEVCGKGSFGKEFYFDGFGEYVSRAPYNADDGSLECLTTHSNWTGPTLEKKKWRWHFASCILEEVGSDNCNQHGPHVHKNVWHVIVTYFVSVPCQGSCTPTTPPTTPPTTITTTTTTQPPPPVVVDPPKFSSTAFTQAQQNVDQRIKFQASVTCNGGKTAPCNMPTEQTSASSGNAGPFVTSIKIDSFTLSPPAGYSSPKQFKVISSPAGSDLLSGPKYATMRFFAATRSGSPYSYTAKATVTYYTQDWSRNGSTYSWGEKYGTTKQAVLTCTPASCTFSVLGSNLG